MPASSLNTSWQNYKTFEFCQLPTWYRLTRLRNIWVMSAPSLNTGWQDYEIYKFCQLSHLIQADKIAKYMTFVSPPSWYRLTRLRNMWVLSALPPDIGWQDYEILDFCQLSRLIQADKIAKHMTFVSPCQLYPIIKRNWFKKALTDMNKQLHGKTEKWCTVFEMIFDPFPGRYVDLYCGIKKLIWHLQSR